MKNQSSEEYKKQDQAAVRLNKYLSEAGVCSRRDADRLIEAGRVKIDGKPARCGMKVLPGQIVTVGEKKIPGKNPTVVLAVNKPVGIICTEDMRTRKNIIRFLNYPSRITYAGRLDKDSQGLLLMTNNGDLINQMMRARYCHEKEYKVRVDKPVTDALIRQLSAGVRITDKEKHIDEITRPCQAEKIGTYTFRIVLTQGLNRQIRRMCAACGYQVKELTRTRIMNIELGDLKTGAYRELTEEELNQLYAGLKVPEGT